MNRLIVYGAIALSFAGGTILGAFLPTQQAEVVACMDYARHTTYSCLATLQTLEEKPGTDFHVLAQIDDMTRGDGFKLLMRLLRTTGRGVL